LKEFFPAKVIKVIDYYEKVVINRGAEHGIKEGQRFLIYALDEELLDPDTGESLGRLELVRGTGKVIHVQEKISTIQSDKKVTERTIKRYKNSAWRAFNGTDEEEMMTPSNVPFDNPENGDLAKPL